MDKPKEENLLYHLRELRMVLIKCLLALAIGLVPMFVAAPYVLKVLIEIISGGQVLTLNFFSPLDVFILELKLAVVLDILICFPYMAKKMWDFLLPALYEHEQRFIKSIVWVSSLLFVAGVLFCLFFILPLVVKFGLSFSSENIKPVLGISNIISLALWLAVIFGGMFQFPLITYALLKARMTTYAALAQKRTAVFVGILIVSGIVTPPDVVSQLMLTLPTYALFELGLWLGRAKN